MRSIFVYRDKGVVYRDKGVVYRDKALFFNPFGNCSNTFSGVRGGEDTPRWARRAAASNS